MKIEKIFRKIPNFEKVILDTILFESKYPVLFTCKNRKDIYLFICYFVNSEKIEWIGTRTTYDNLIELLENKITIRDAFFNVTNNKIMVGYDGKEVRYELKKSSEISEDILPTVGEYMDAEEGEYEEEIAEFKKRNKNVEYVIQPQISKFLLLRYKTVSVLNLEKDSEIDLDVRDVFCYPIEINHNQKVNLA
jgi:hypothetical protein